jgi:hypothetical protein
VDPAASVVRPEAGRAKTTEKLYRHFAASLPSESPYLIDLVLQRRRAHDCPEKVLR